MKSVERSASSIFVIVPMSLARSGPSLSSEERPELELRGDLRDDLEELELLEPVALDGLHGAMVLDGHRGLLDHGLQEDEVGGHEAAPDLVQQLRDADALALQGDDRHAQDALRRVPRHLVDVAIEALVRISVVDDRPHTRLEDVAGDAEPAWHPHLALEPAVTHA
jgi:hypothetical protein